MNQITYQAEEDGTEFVASASLQEGDLVALNRGNDDIEKVSTTNGDDPFLGVALESVAQGDPVRVAIFGKVRVKANSNVAAGNELAPDENVDGLVQDFTSASASPPRSVGFAAGTASSNGDVIPAYLRLTDMY